MTPEPLGVFCLLVWQFKTPTLSLQQILNFLIAFLSPVCSRRNEGLSSAAAQLHREDMGKACTLGWKEDLGRGSLAACLS